MKKVIVPPSERRTETRNPTVNDTNLPYFEQLSNPIPPEEAFRRLCRQPHCVFLDSALSHPEFGRYSYLCADPIEFVRIDRAKSDDPDPNQGLERLESILFQYVSNSIPDLPPFQGGAAGLLSYDLGQSLEKLPVARFDEFAIPAIALGLYDVVMSFDRLTNKAWIVSHGFTAENSTQSPSERRERAVQRANQFRRWIESTRPVGQHGVLPFAAPEPIVLQGPQFASNRFPGLRSNFGRSEYLQAVQRVVDYIHAGDAFQVNLSQRLTIPATSESATLYNKLRERNPATFAGYFDLGDFQIVSASPERFVRVQDRIVETRPIKGTRPRVLSPEADLFAGEELRGSEKDMAENVMIVDLMRNDLSRVCEPDSVCVQQLCAIESYEFVQHLVSSVTGRLASEFGPIDLLRASFPGGSITGAPKVRAMEIIAELEPHTRGAYCGSLGFIGFDGSMDFNILIRTITAGKGWWQFPVGGGIVAQSDPKAEYEETWHKAEGMLRAFAR